MRCFSPDCRSCLQLSLSRGISQQLQERKAEALAQISSAFEDLEQAAAAQAGSGQRPGGHLWGQAEGASALALSHPETACCRPRLSTPVHTFPWPLVSTSSSGQ